MSDKKAILRVVLHNDTVLKYEDAETDGRDAKFVVVWGVREGKRTIDTIAKAHIKAFAYQLQ